MHIWVPGSFERVELLPTSAMAKNTISTRFLVLSDTHDSESGDTQDSWSTQPIAPHVDVLLHCGDLTQVGGVPSFKKALKRLSSIDAELKLVIAGNHDLELDKLYWTNEPEEHDRALNVMTGSIAAEAGVTYLTEGTHYFTLSSGAKFSIYASPYTPVYGDWAFTYERNQDRFSIRSNATTPIPNNVDIVMTHGPPKGVLDWCPDGHVGCENSYQAVRRAKPIIHCFGHVHGGYGTEVMDWTQPRPKEKALRKNEAIHRQFEEEEDEAFENPYPDPIGGRYEKGNRTLAVNTAIHTGPNTPENLPWLVTVELPKSSSNQTR